MTTKKDPTDIGTNRTGIAMSPIDSKQLIDGALAAEPSSQGSETQLRTARQEYIREAGVVGTMPPPASLKGVATTTMKMMKGEKPNVFLDKLGERLAFERTGTRLYEGLIAKCQTMNGDRAVMDRLTLIHRQEMEHFGMLAAVIRKLGADPTTETPCADVTGVASLGLLQVVNDPRTTIAQSLSAVLIAELADTDGWHILISLAHAMGHEDIVSMFQTAAKHEEEHVAFVRSLLTKLTLDEAQGEGSKAH